MKLVHNKKKGDETENRFGNNQFKYFVVYLYDENPSLTLRFVVLV